jgi:hypothetical protein
MRTVSPWSVIIILSSVVAGLLTFTNSGATVRTAIVLWFLLVCPGMALARFFDLHEPLVEWTLAVTLSLVVDTFVAGAFLLAGRWSPTSAFAVLLGIAIVGALAQEAKAFRTGLQKPQ